MVGAGAVGLVGVALAAGARVTTRPAGYCSESPVPGVNRNPPGPLPIITGAVMGVGLIPGAVSTSAAGDSILAPSTACLILTRIFGSVAYSGVAGAGIWAAV